MEGLNLQEGGVYVDVTFGGGGHSKQLLKLLRGGKLIVFDQDDDARANAAAIEDERLVFVAANFRHLKKYLKLKGSPRVDGILADLGISSHQIDTAARGFSTRFDAPLDMRMDRQTGKTAHDIVQEYSQDALIKLFRLYGELPNAAAVAREIVNKRAVKPIQTTGELTDILKKFAKRGKEYKFFAQVFQALRLEVNDELGALQALLTQAAEVLKPGGRLVVMSYHSLEDRLVKHFMRTGNFEGEPEKDLFGNLIRPLKPLTIKPIFPSDQEVAANSRARSARLRVAEKI